MFNLKSSYFSRNLVDPLNMTYQLYNFFLLNNLFTLLYFLHLFHLEI